MSTELSPKATARRASILSAARTIFVRDGYHDTKLTVVAKEAGCSVGTLYTYFDNREALLSAVLDVVEEEMREANSDKNTNLSPAQRVSVANRAYLASFRANAKEMALMEQVAQFDATVNEHRTTRAQRFQDRNARLIAKVSTVPDPEMTATALSIMVSRLAYNTWVDGLFPDTDETFERIAATVDEVWFRTLGLERPAQQHRQPHAQQFAQNQ